MSTPVYAVIFSSQRSADVEGYAETSERMLELARLQPGFIEVESSRGTDGFGITVSYWDSLEAIRAWKLQVEHLQAQNRGRSDWYQRYRVRIARVEREYAFAAPADQTSE